MVSISIWTLAGYTENNRFLSFQVYGRARITNRRGQGLHHNVACLLQNGLRRLAQDLSHRA